MISIPRTFYAVLFLALSTGALSAQVQDEIELTRQVIQTERQAIIISGVGIRRKLRRRRFADEMMLHLTWPGRRATSLSAACRCLISTCHSQATMRAATTAAAVYNVYEIPTCTVLGAPG